uniref:Uncharacterized protein n=1 Tax=Anguilla anguilla TaxID=7936 RepID=A0A0E9VP33_ANGAN
MTAYSTQRTCKKVYHSPHAKNYEFKILKLHFATNNCQIWDGATLLGPVLKGGHIDPFDMDNATAITVHGRSSVKGLQMSWG